jgi:uncharacterized protein (DUF433 family)/DNA-binding transcriptional MerR regulator
LASEFLTVAIYDIPEVARLSQLSHSRVRRWLRGYSYEYGDGASRQTRHQAPVVPREEAQYASFLDLIELRFAKAFLDRGFSPQKVRAAFAEAAELTGEDHPFARRRFFGMGLRIFLELQRQRPLSHRRAEPHNNLLELLTHGQWAIGPIVREYASQVRFDRRSRAVTSWWPLGRRMPVMIDPRISAGAPVLKGHGIRTANLYDLYLGESRNARAVADWMSVSVADVEAAVRFEEEWSLPKAA